MLRRALVRHVSRLIEMREGQVQLPVPNRPATLEMGSKTLATAVADLKSQGFRKIEFLTLQGVRFSAQSLLSHLSTTSFLLKLDEHSFHVIPEQRLPLGSIEDQIKQLRLTFNDKEIIRNYLLELASHIDFKKERDIPMEELTKSLEDGLPREKLTYRSREEMEEKLKEYTAEYSRLTQFDKGFAVKARRHAMRIVWTGLLILLLQWGYIGLGTFVYYSWDVMEPQAYLLGLGNLLFGIGFYVFKRREFAMGSVIAALKEAKMNQLYSRAGINTRRVVQLKEYIDHIEKIIKT